MRILLSINRNHALNSWFPVDTCSISTGDGWTEGTGKGIRGSNHRRDTVSCFLSYNQGRVPVQPQRWVTHVLRTRDSRIDNRLNLRNEFDSLGIEDFLERTDHYLPYPLRRNRLSALVVAVTFGVVDTCSTSPGFPRPTIDWEEQVWGAVHYGRATFLENSRGKDAFRLPKQIYSA
jgi:hypothetical protein